MKSNLLGLAIVIAGPYAVRSDRQIMASVWRQVQLKRALFVIVPNLGQYPKPLAC